jgi:DNA-binding NtrC family response regulator
MNEFRILVVDDDADMASSCAKLFRKQGFTAEYVTSGEAALDTMRRSEPFHVLLTDIRLGSMNGVDVMRQCQAEFPKTKVILMTGYGSISNAVSAIKLGAADYLTKPFDRDELLQKVGNLHHIFELENEVAELQQCVQDRNEPHIISNSPSMAKVFHLIEAASRSNCSVIIRGESGTGKDLVARTIHNKSPRRARPFISLNCGALPTELVESELFGYRKGAFTGAYRDYNGLFRAAEGGTLLLDEITEMAPMLQVKLLRVLQESKVRPVGDTQEIPVDVCIIAVTNQNIQQMVAEKKFREDLYYRLKVIEIFVPPLRERKVDIELLVNYFIQQFNNCYHKEVQPVVGETLDILKNYPWPGNVRELQHTVESIFAIHQDLREILPEHLPTEMRAHKSKLHLQNSQNVVLSLSETERRLVEQALRVTDYNKKKAAEILGISRTRLYKKIEDYGIEVPR